MEPDWLKSNQKGKKERKKEREEEKEEESEESNPFNALWFLSSFPFFFASIFSFIE